MLKNPKRLENDLGLVPQEIALYPTPQKWAVEGIEKIVMYGKGMEDILPNLGILVLMGTVFFIIGVKKI
ncbi:hypothetical protein [Proteiniborus sp. MB09-C3]|uniref:hypothetical protein n=1 Tax=Proteiniborus sp. MB09-C3 TaxID=3050072 RepID=UPI0025543CB0|nr:hypothetical protein [Proteiniborus sp. MB09-C3]WIV10591.1 hypothetical protein QO263_10520 [Proteiniborus sp. MB09-C3]